jgi:hypothetical protein
MAFLKELTVTQLVNFFTVRFIMVTVRVCQGFCHESDECGLCPHNLIFKIHVNNILLLTPRPPRLISCPEILQSNFIQVSHLSHQYYMPFHIVLYLLETKIFTRKKTASIRV